MRLGFQIYVCSGEMSLKLFKQQLLMCEQYLLYKSALLAPSKNSRAFICTTSKLSSQFLSGWSWETLTRSQRVCTIMTYPRKKERKKKKLSHKYMSLHFYKHVETAFSQFGVCKNQTGWTCLCAAMVVMSSLIKLLCEWCGFTWCSKHKEFLEYPVEMSLTSRLKERRCALRRNELSKRISEYKNPKLTGWRKEKKQTMKTLMADVALWIFN